MIVAAGIVGAALLLAILPTPLRGVAQAALLFAVILSPLVALGFVLGRWNAVRIGTWFLYVPLTVIYLASIDLRFGISARLARAARPTSER